MVDSTPLLFIQKQLDYLLSAVDRFIWQSEQSVDTLSNYFFVFKAFPKELKAKQRVQWAELQAQTLSPFSNSSKYCYLSDAGLHLWVSQGQAKGIPETAIQQNLSDGEHQIQGEHKQYVQTWKNGIMLKCFTLSASSGKTQDSKLNLEIHKHSAWAVRRKIDKQLQQPTTWIGLGAFVSLCALVWLGAASLTLQLQESNGQKKIDLLETTLGEQLAEQSRLQNAQQTLMLLRNWHNEHGFLPESIGAVATKLNLRGEWKANSISWQNHTLEIELLAANLDIAALVGELENIDMLKQVNIRPHAADDTWILEANIK
jgi:Tfp pilus assembly protein PilN